MAKARVKREPVVQPQNQSIRFIPLTKGLVAVVDATDYEWLSQYNWYATKNGTKIYACRSITVDGKRKPVYMHRMIFPDAPEVDHEDQDGLNNRRGNLRRSTHSQNNTNKGLRPDNKSGYKGVSKNHNNYMANITVNGKFIYLGTRPTAREAALLYDVAAREHHGAYACLNFPDEK
jgi:hypothetical protein